MTFVYTANGLQGKERVLQRVLEILPGATSWTIIIGMIVLAIVEPLAASVIIIAFYLYWLFRLIYMTLFLVLSYFRLSAEKATDWMARVRDLDRGRGHLEDIVDRRPGGGLKEKISFWEHRRLVRDMVLAGAPPPSLEEIYHLVIIPVATELPGVIRSGIAAISRSTFPPQRILMVLALEERASGKVKRGVYELREQFKGAFMDIIVSEHPDGISGEAKAKGANTTYAAKTAARYFSEKGIPFANVVSSCFDSDTVVKEDYFACLTYYFMTCPKRERASFQPVPDYNNNIWQAPGITRVLEVGASFFQLIEATNPEKLVTFSSHSMSFKALVEVGYWPVDMISDDSAIYWRSFIHYEGAYRVVPMYTTLSMDAVVAGGWWQTLVNVYKQKRRWAWGVENFPIVIRGFISAKKIPLRQKIKNGYKLFEGHVSWTTWAFLLTVIGWLPALFAGRDYSHTVLYYSVPRITGVIFHLATISLVTSMILSLCLLPKRKKTYSFLRRIGFAFQWLLVPFTMIFLSALPALDAQTRLMMGKYLTFWVTDKTRK